MEEIWKHICLVCGISESVQITPQALTLNVRLLQCTTIIFPHRRNVLFAYIISLIHPKFVAAFFSQMMCIHGETWSFIKSITSYHLMNLRLIQFYQTIKDHILLHILGWRRNVFGRTPTHLKTLNSTNQCTDDLNSHHDTFCEIMCGIWQHVRYSV